MIEKIISNESLQVKSEDKLLEFVIEKYEEDPTNNNLFEYVEFQNVNEETVEKFIEQFSISDLNQAIWRSICKRLLPSKNSQIKQERYKTIEKYHAKGKEFFGLMRYLTEETGGNIHDNGTIEITSNSISSDGYHPKNLVDYTNNTNIYDSKSNIENAKVFF